MFSKRRDFASCCRKKIFVADVRSTTSGCSIAPNTLVLISAQPLGTLADGGLLGDVAPTLLPLLGLEVPKQMTGRNLLVPAEQEAG